MSDELSLSIVRHPFRRDLRETSVVPFTAGMSLLDLRREHFPADLSVLIHVNGGLVPCEKWDSTVPCPGDYVLLSAALAGGDGKSIFRMVLMLAVAVAAPYIAGPAVLGLTGLASAAFIGGFTLAGGLLVNALLPAQTSTPTADSAISDSQAYSWAPTNTEQQGIPVAKWYGRHKVYGNIIGSYIENQGKTQILNALVCLGLGPVDSLANFKINDQPVQNFDDVIIKTRLGRLDQGVIENFNNTKTEYVTSVEVVYGSPCTYTTSGDDFDALEVDIAFPGGLWYTDGKSVSLLPASVGIRIEARKVGTGTWKYVTLQPPDYTCCAFKKFSSRAVHNAPRWSLGRRVNISTPYVVDGLNYFKTERYWWDYAAGSNAYADHEEGESGGTAGFHWHWVGPVPAEYRTGDDSANLVEKVVQLAPGAENTQVNITGATSNALYHTYSYDIPEGEKGRYQIRVTRVSPNANSLSCGDRCYFAGVREIQTDDFTYPRHVLVSVRATATDQLSGSLRLSCVGKMAIVQVWDGLTHAGAANVHTEGLSTTVTTSGDAFAFLAVGDEIIANGRHRRVIWKTSANQATVHAPVDWDNSGAGHGFQWRHFALQWSDNPAWVAYDVFTQPVISGRGTAESPYAVCRFDGIDPSRMDIIKFKEWADYCNEPVPDGAGGTEPRITFNGGFDFDTTMWEAGLKVCQVGRATPVWNGVHLTLAIDKPSDPVNLYTVGNIEESRFKEIFLPLEERAARIEIDYVNRASGYERDKLTVYRPDISGGNYTASIDLFGITKASEAWRAGMYRLNCNRYIIRSAEIDVDIEALNAQLGDVVYIQHDVPRWGQGGRIVSAAQGTVTLDKQVTIEAGLTYKLLLRAAEDVVHERQILTCAGVHNELRVFPDFDTSAEFSATGSYAAGDTARYAGRIYRCIQSTSVLPPIPANTGYWELTDFCPLPEQYDIYAFGQVETFARRFRVTDIAKSQDQKVTLSLAEYRPEIYEFEEVEPPVNDFTQAVLKQMEPEDVILVQKTVSGPGGRIAPCIGIAFTRSDDESYGGTEIWYALKTSTDDRKAWEWHYAGSTVGEAFEIIGGLEYSQRYAVVLIPFDSNGNRLYHGRAALHGIFLQTVTRAADIRYGDVPGISKLHTSGPSTTVETTDNAFAYLRVGYTIIANGQRRTVARVPDPNTITVNEAVDWDNSGEGYAFTYDAPLNALTPAEPEATRGAILGSNLLASDAQTVLTASQLWGPDLPAGRPEAAGLYTVSGSIGYFDGTVWKVYIGSDGKFYFKGDSGNFVQWDGAALVVRGSLDASDLTAGSLHADRITANSIETVKIADNACTGKATAAAASFVTSTEGWITALSVSLTLTVGSWVLVQASIERCTNQNSLQRSIHVRRGGTVLKEMRHGYNFVSLDTPGVTGSVTFDLQVEVWQGETVTCQDLLISVIELRR